MDAGERRLDHIPNIGLTNPLTTCWSRGTMVLHPSAEVTMVRECVVCESEFDTHSKAKRLAGGLNTHCPDCSEEDTPRYAGVAAGEGKMSSVQILKFSNTQDREAYLEYWKVNSGLYKGKSCQIGHGLKKTPNIQFQTMATFTGNTNHKGKA